MKDIFNGHHKEIITKPEIQFWVPIIATIVSVTIWGMSISNKVDLVIHKIDTIEELAESNRERGDRFAQVLNDWASRLVRLETKIE